MKCIVRAPWRIKIGNNTFVNENCYLDGRGELIVGNNTSISLFSMIISASHDMKSDSFEYRKGKVYIGDNVWIGAKAIVLDRTNIKDKCVISAGSVIKGETEEEAVYCGNPAVKIKERRLENRYSLSFRDYLR